MNKTNTMMTKRLPMTPTVPMMPYMTLSARSRTCEISFSDWAVVTLFHPTSLNNDKFSAITAVYKLSQSSTSAAVVYMLSVQLQRRRSNCGCHGGPDTSKFWSWVSAALTFWQLSCSNSVVIDKKLALKAFYFYRETNLALHTSLTDSGQDMERNQYEICLQTRHSESSNSIH